MSDCIVVAYDHSPASKEALAWAASQAQLTGARVHVVNVIDPYPPAAGAPMAVIPVLTQDDLDATIKSLRDAIRATAPGATADVVLHPQTADAIVQAAKDQGATLIAIGTHGRTGIAHFLLGSVAERVVRFAPCPVLITHAPPEP